MKLFTLVLALMTFNAFAGEVKLAVTHSEFDKNTGIFSIEIDSKNTIKGVHYINQLPNGGIERDISEPAERVIQDGMVLEERNGLDVIVLQVENFDLKLGGTFKLNYLVNGITRTRHNKRLVLKLVNGKFSLFDQNKEVNRFYIKANSTALGVIGVKDIQTSYVAERSN